MSKFNLQSILFAFIVLALVLTGKTGARDSAYAPAESQFNSASLTAILAPGAGAVSDNVSAIAPGAVTRERFSGAIVDFAVPEPAREPIAPPATTAQAALVKELKSGAKIFEKDGSRRWPLASLTKLMTAVVARESFRGGERVTVGAAAVESAGSAGDFQAGEVFRAEDLINAALVISSNDAAAALADFYGARDFVEKMNAQAMTLKMEETIFFDPTGLSVLNQTGVADLEKLVSYILKHHPAVFEVTTRPKITVTELNSEKARSIGNNNRFAGRPDFLGGKTGYLDDANGNLISLFTDAKRENQFLIIVLGADDRFLETEKLYEWAKKNF